MYLGNEESPAILHSHVWGRGLPEKPYIGGVRLRGPAVGELFDLRGNGAADATVPGNNAKVAWKGDEPKKVRDTLKVSLQRKETPCLESLSRQAS